MDITINLYIAIIVFTSHIVGFMCMEMYAFTVKNVVCPAHHFAVTPVEYMHTFKLSVAITPNYIVCMHTL